MHDLDETEVPVPNVVGFSWDDAREIGERLGLFVRGPDPDGPPLAELGWPGGVVVDQHPDPGARVALGSTLILWIERGPGSAGVREPRRPRPDPKVLRGEADEPTAGSTAG
jgi:beta-lactam-binding protein with PASTA domain